MDLATLIGLFGAIAIILLAMVLGGGLGNFFNVPSLLVVVGGTLTVALSKFGLSEFLSAIRIAVKAFVFKQDKPEDLIDTAVKMANAARKGGLLSLESFELDNEFMKKGLGMIVDGIEQDVVRTALVKDMKHTVERHETGQQIFKAIGDVAPAMGMIGTLIGLVLMLANMADPKQIGPAMAVALLTTLYGSLIANVIAFPIADKLALRTAQEKQSKSLIIDALMGIQNGENPRVVEQILMTYLPPSKRKNEDNDTAESGAGEAATE